jgi:hypothetical protein
MAILNNDKLSDMDIGYGLIGENILLNKLMIIRFSWGFFCRDKAPAFEDFANLLINPETQTDKGGFHPLKQCVFLWNSKFLSTLFHICTMSSSLGYDDSLVRRHVEIILIDA